MNSPPLSPPSPGRAEERLDELDGRHQERLEAVGRLAGGVAHGFNNLLTVILGVAQGLRAGLPADDPHGKDLEDVIDAANRASLLTKQLLAFGRRQVMTPATLDLNRLIVSLRPIARSLLGQGIRLKTSLDPRLGSVKADPCALEQVIITLGLNARDAMPRGGELEVKTGHIDIGAEEARRRGVSPGPHVFMAISDTGCGMPPETLAHVFEPFYTTKEDGKGTGMGLATVYGIIKQHAGDISVESAPGKGTTFCIYLPRTRDAAPRPRKEPSEKETPSGGNETILVTEDEEIVRRIVVSSLRKRGYTVLEAHDAREARDVSETHGGPIHLLLTDVVMPGMNGRDLAAALAARRPGMKVLYMSGYDGDIVLQRGILQPGMDFIEKSFTPDSLGRKLRGVLDAPPRQIALFPEKVGFDPPGG